jgi:hypothetical protein
MHRTSAVTYERMQPDRLFSIPPQRRASRGNNEDHERGNRQCPHDSVVKVVAWSPRTGSYGQRNHSDHYAKDGNQISQERCSPCLRRLSQDSMKAALRLVLSAAKASIAPRFAKANSRPTTLLPDYITNDSEVGFSQMIKHAWISHRVGRQEEAD